MMFVKLNRESLAKFLDDVLNSRGSGGERFIYGRECVFYMNLTAKEVLESEGVDRYMVIAFRLINMDAWFKQELQPNFVEGTEEILTAAAGVREAQSEAINIVAGLRELMSQVGAMIPDIPEPPMPPNPPMPKEDPNLPNMAALRELMEKKAMNDIRDGMRVTFPRDILHQGIPMHFVGMTSAGKGRYEGRNATGNMARVDISPEQIPGFKLGRDGDLDNPPLRPPSGEAYNTDIDEGVIGFDEEGERLYLSDNENYVKYESGRLRSVAYRNDMAHLLDNESDDLLELRNTRGKNVFRNDIRRMMREKHGEPSVMVNFDEKMSYRQVKHGQRLLEHEGKVVAETDEPGLFIPIVDSDGSPMTKAEFTRAYGLSDKNEREVFRREDFKGGIIIGTEADTSKALGVLKSAGKKLEGFGVIPPSSEAAKMLQKAIEAVHELPDYSEIERQSARAEQLRRDKASRKAAAAKVNNALRRGRK